MGLNQFGTTIIIILLDYNLIKIKKLKDNNTFKKYGNNLLQSTLDLVSGLWIIGIEIFDYQL